MVILRQAQRKSAKERDGDVAPQKAVQQSNPRLCVDIGTTTVAIELYDSAGQFVDGAQENNRQLLMGSDVMMRLMHVKQGRGKRLTEEIRAQIYEMGMDLLQKHRQLFADKLIPECVYLVGNTVMCHLLLEKDCTGLMGAPFRSAYEGSYMTTGAEIGWQSWEQTTVYVLPGIAAHVGADAAAMFGELELWHTDKKELAVDIGTNAEMFLNVNGKVVACSTAAGPAFEGQGIHCGKRAGVGVVNGVKLMRGNGAVVLDVIAEQPQVPAPVGLCGSGLIDAIAQMLQYGIVTKDGYMLSQEEARKKGCVPAFAARQRLDSAGEKYFVLYEAGVDGRGEKDLVVTQSDIRTFQLAKAAIRAGMEMMLARQHLTVNDLDALFVAGVFGGFLHPENAKKTGLLPDLPMHKLQFVGNAAGRGAAKVMRQPNFVKEWTEQISRVEHIELADEPDFQTVYMQAMELAHW